MLKLNLNEVQNEIREISERYDLFVDPEKKIQELSVGEQQRVEIVKVLYRGARILILDEPTAVLTPQESEALYEIMQRMTNEKHSIIFITHKMKEVMALSRSIYMNELQPVIGVKKFLNSVNQNKLIGSNRDKHSLIQGLKLTKLKTYLISNLRLY